MPNESDHKGAATIKFVTISGMIVNLLLSAMKVAAGYFGKSQSVIADGIHSLSDCATDIAILIGLKYWNEPPDECHPYGHRRYETLVTAFIGIILFLAGAALSYEAILKFKTGKFTIPNNIALYAAVASIITKELLYRWTDKKGQEINSSSMIANAWHHRTDAISSVAVAIAIWTAQNYPGWGLLDPIAAAAVGVFIIQAAWHIFAPSIKELIDKGAEPEQIEKIKNIVLEIEGVQSYHALRTRFQGSRLQVDLHLQVDGNITVDEGHKIAGNAKKKLINSQEAITDVLIHIEPYELQPTTEKCNNDKTKG